MAVHADSVQARIQLHRKGVAVLRGAVGAASDGVVDEVGDVEDLGRELHLAGLDLRQVQDFVDQPEKVLAGGMDLLQVHRFALAVGVFEQDFAVADHRVERGAQLMAHAGHEFGLGQPRPFGLGGGLPQLLGGGEVTLHLGLELDAGGQDLGVIERHHRHIQRGGDGGDDAQALHGDGGRVVEHLRAQDLQQEETGQVGHAHADHHQAQLGGRAHVQERQQRDGEHPRQGRRTHPAIEVAAPQDAEDQVLHRQQRQQVVAAGRLQQEGEQPEDADRGGEHRHRIAGRRIEEEQRQRNGVADERAADVADQEHPGALAGLTLGGDLGRDEPVDQPVQAGQQPVRRLGAALGFGARRMRRMRRRLGLLDLHDPTTPRSSCRR